MDKPFYVELTDDGLILRQDRYRSLRTINGGQGHPWDVLFITHDLAELNEHIAMMGWTGWVDGLPDDKATGAA